MDDDRHRRAERKRRRTRRRRRGRHARAGSGRYGDGDGDARVPFLGSCGSIWVAQTTLSPEQLRLVCQGAAAQCPVAGRGSPGAESHDVACEEASRSTWAAQRAQRRSRRVDVTHIINLAEGAEHLRRCPVGCKCAAGRERRPGTAARAATRRRFTYCDLRLRDAAGEEIFSSSSRRGRHQRRGGRAAASRPRAGISLQHDAIGYCMRGAGAFEFVKAQRPRPFAAVRLRASSAPTAGGRRWTATRTTPRWRSTMSIRRTRSLLRRRPQLRQR